MYRIRQLLVLMKRSARTKAVNVDHIWWTHRCMHFVFIIHEIYGRQAQWERPNLLASHIDRSLPVGMAKSSSYPDLSDSIQSVNFSFSRLIAIKLKTEMTETIHRTYYNFLNCLKVYDFFIIFQDCQLQIRKNLFYYPSLSTCQADKTLNGSLVVGGSPVLCS